MVSAQADQACALPELHEPSLGHGRGRLRDYNANQNTCRTRTVDYAGDYRCGDSPAPPTGGMRVTPMTEEQKTDDEPVAEEEVAVVEEDEDDADKPLTSEEVKEAASDLYNHAKNAWVKPVRKEVWSWFRSGKDFLDGLGGTDPRNTKKKGD